MNIVIWAGFILSIVVMIGVARKNLWLGFIAGAIVLGVLNLSARELFNAITRTITDPSILFLAFSVGTIPLIGGVLEESGLMDVLVSNLKLKRKLFLIFGPAFLGMLPMPGGALLSAPLVRRAGDDIPNNQLALINVWFRHVLVLVYPLGPLLVTAKIAHLNLYKAMLYLFPGFILMLILGYIFFLRGIEGNLQTQKSLKLKRIFSPIIIIITAPVIHLSLMSIFPSLLQEIPLIIGVLCSLSLAVIMGKLPLKKMTPVIKRMRPWKYFMIIIGMFLFLNTFIASNISEIIASAVSSRHFLVIIIGPFLGFVTGRVQIPVAIILPIYFSITGVEHIGYLPFICIFFSVFMGYIISPIHPCVSVSLEFFDTSLKKFFVKLLPVTLICVAAAAAVSLIFT